MEGLAKKTILAFLDAVEAIGPTRLRIAWATGERLEVDLAEPINRLQALAPLRDPAAFARVQVGEWGHSPVWEGEIDLGADRLYERCKEQAVRERAACA